MSDKEKIYLDEREDAHADACRHCEKVKHDKAGRPYLYRYMVSVYGTWWRWSEGLYCSKRCFWREEGVEC